MICFGQQIAARDVRLFVLGVAGQPDDLHAVEQRRRDVERVRGADEHHLGEIEVDLEVVIAERGVLLGIEHLEQRRRRVTAEVHRHLVDFVEQVQRIAYPGPRHVLHDLAGHRADIGAAVPAYLGLVTHAAQRHAHELAVRRPRNALPQRGLAHAGRADQTQDRALERLHALLDGQVLDDALLDLVEAEVVLVEHPLGRRDVVLDLGALLPRDLHQPVDVVAHHGRLGRHRRHELELRELGARLVPGFLRHAGACDALLELGDLVGRVVHLAQFLLDRLHLLVEVVLALALLHLLLDAAADALLDLQHVHFALDQGEDVLKAAAHVLDLEHLLLGIELEGHVRGDGVGEPARLLDARERGQDLRRHLAVELYVLLKLRDDGADQHVHFALFVLLGVAKRCYLRGEVVARGELRDRCPLGPLDQHLDRAVRQLEELQNRGDRPDLVEILGLRIVDIRLLLREQQDLLVHLHRLLEREDGLLTAHEQRYDHVGIHDDVAQRQHRQRIGGDSGLECGVFGRHAGSLQCAGSRARQVPIIVDTRAGFKSEDRRNRVQSRFFAVRDRQFTAGTEIRLWADFLRIGSVPVQWSDPVRRSSTAASRASS